MKRYVFHMHMFNCSCDLNAVDKPTEVYFTEFVPAPFEVTDGLVTASVVVKNAAEFTFFTLQYTSNNLADWADRYAGYTRNYVFRIEFINKTSSVWEEGLGWPLNTTIYDYPCAVSGSMTVTALKIRCDLHTYTYAGPTPETSLYPFVDVYGLATSAFNAPGKVLIVKIPKIKLRAYQVAYQSAEIRFKVKKIN